MGTLRFVAPMVLAVLLAATAVDAEAVPERCAEVPCGFVTPLIDLDFPDKPQCGQSLVLGVEGDPSTCLAPPTEGNSIVMEGAIRWYWDVTAEATYPNDPLEDIVISFQRTTTNPQWISFDVEPSSFTLNTVDLFDPRHFDVREGEGTQAQVYFWFEQPITVTFTRTGEPEGRDLERLLDREGVISVFVKASSTASGDRFREGFGIEEFKFHVANDPELAGLVESRDTPSLGVVPLLGLLALALVALRGRVTRRP